MISLHPPRHERERSLTSALRIALLRRRVGLSYEAAMLLAAFIWGEP
jgi:hypothetical protein